jgi:RNA polymerase sigma factor for flagellar operon FliA
MDNMENVWKTYAKSRDPELKNHLILKYAQLVKIVAGRLVIHVGQHVGYEDLISYGIFGLIDAIDKFDPFKGVKFETYASLRIRGSIIDNIRKMDWIPRTLRQKNKQLEQVFSQFESETGRTPTDEELAERLNITVDEARSMISKSSVASLISLDEHLDQNQEGAFESGIMETMPDTPEELYEKKELQDLLAKSISNLSEKEKIVINLYYYEDLTLKEISKIMGVTESRISQIHSKAVLRLQVKLGKYKSLLFS